MIYKVLINPKVNKYLYDSEGVLRWLGSLRFVATCNAGIKTKAKKFLSAVTEVADTVRWFPLLAKTGGD